MGPWLQSAAGRYLLDWEQAQMDTALADVFGFHALQLGLPGYDLLRENRITHRMRIDVAGDVAVRANIKEKGGKVASVDLGREELAWLDGLDSRQRWETIEKIVQAKPLDLGHSVDVE